MRGSSLSGGLCNSRARSPVYLRGPADLLGRPARKLGGWPDGPKTSRQNAYGSQPARSENEVAWKGRSPAAGASSAFLAGLDCRAEAPLSWSVAYALLARPRTRRCTSADLAATCRRSPVRRNLTADGADRRGWIWGGSGICWRCSLSRTPVMDIKRSTSEEKNPLSGCPGRGSNRGEVRAARTGEGARGHLSCCALPTKILGGGYGQREKKGGKPKKYGLSLSRAPVMEMSWTRPGLVDSASAVTGLHDHRPQLAADRVQPVIESQAGTGIQDAHPVSPSSLRIAGPCPWRSRRHAARAPGFRRSAPPGEAPSAPVRRSPAERRAAARCRRLYARPYPHPSSRRRRPFPTVRRARCLHRGRRRIGQ